MGWRRQLGQAVAGGPSRSWPGPAQEGGSTRAGLHQAQLDLGPEGTRKREAQMFLLLRQLEASEA